MHTYAVDRSLTSTERLCRNVGRGNGLQESSQMRNDQVPDQTEAALNSLALISLDFSLIENFKDTLSQQI